MATLHDLPILYYIMTNRHDFSEETSSQTWRNQQNSPRQCCLNWSRQQNTASNEVSQRGAGWCALCTTNRWHQCHRGQRLGLLDEMGLHSRVTTVLAVVAGAALRVDYPLYLADEDGKRKGTKDKIVAVNVKVDWVSFGNTRSDYNLLTNCFATYYPYPCL